LKKLASLGGVAGLAVVVLLSARGQAADHRESRALAATPMADITDVYTWMAGSNLNLVMDLSPSDDGSHSFDPSVQYVFHLTSKAGLGPGMSGGTETRVILRFASSTSVECWVTDAGGTTTKDYVSGDPSNTAGVTSIHGKVRVFAGRRSDPAFYNAAGFASGAAELGANIAGKDAAGCPTAINSAEAMAIRTLLTGGADSFATQNVMAIVVQLDKALVNTGTNTTVSVWGSTHAGS
jgi:hypothetical protein